MIGTFSNGGEMGTTTSIRAGMDVSNSTDQNTGYRVVGAGGN